ncbi:MAG: toll/interleukin-1 receptor domain-containing protein [Muribaculaceae bacterium]|nr:toll/interleukin-1 receptor domain-containing protein [Muribaculaceae bacterium]
MNYDVFISYSRKDTPVADRICAALDAAGISYFIDRQGIAGGLEFPDVLAEAILNSRLFLLLASRNSYESKFTGSEITFAFNKKAKNTILPYIIDDSELPIGMQLVFSSINWRNINQHPLEVLTSDLCALLGRPHNPVAQPTQPTNAQTVKWYNDGVDASKRGNHAEAVRFYTLAANAGHTSAQYNLALKYSKGEGVAQNEAEAARLFRLAADKGDTDAQCALGYRYATGKGVPQDKSEAARIYRKAAEQGSTIACYNLGLYYKNGTGGLPVSINEARKWFLKAADKGDEDARRLLKEIEDNEARKQTSVELSRLFNSGVDASRRGDHAEAVRLYTLAANAGHRTSQYNLALKYSKGEGVAQNEAEAVRLFRLAADKGDADALCSLGYRYDVGKGVPKDQREAARLYRQSADMGNATACYNLYVFYKNGLGGLPKDLSEAHRWLRTAADKGHEKARETLSKI